MGKYDKLRLSIQSAADPKDFLGHVLRGRNEHSVTICSFLSDAYTRMPVFVIVQFFLKNGISYKAKITISKKLNCIEY